MCLVPIVAIALVAVSTYGFDLYLGYQAASAIRDGMNDPPEPDPFLTLKRSRVSMARLMFRPRRPGQRRRMLSQQHREEGEYEFDQAKAELTSALEQERRNHREWTEGEVERLTTLAEVAARPSWRAWVSFGLLLADVVVALIC